MQHRGALPNGTATCRRSRAELDTLLKDCDFGVKHAMFGCYFEYDPVKQPLCIACKQSIAFHGSQPWLSICDRFAAGCSLLTRRVLLAAGSLLVCFTLAVLNWLAAGCSLVFAADRYWLTGGLLGAGDSYCLNHVKESPKSTPDNDEPLRSSGTNMPDTAFPEAALDVAHESLQCPITQETLVDPVIASDGYVYERGAIESHFCVWGVSVRSPMTNTPLTNTTLIPCTVTVACLRAWQRASVDGAGRGANGQCAMTDVGSQVVSLQAQLLSDVDCLVKDLAAAGIDDATAQPIIVSVGLEGVGKSTVLERLVGIPVFPRGEARCTRMPIRLIIQRGPSQPPLVRVAPFNETTSERRWRWLPAALPLDMIPSVVKDVMDAEVAGKEFIADRELQITIQAPHAPQLHLLDLPGLPGSDHGEDGRGAAKELLRKTIDRVKATSQFLWIRAAQEELSNSSIASVLRQCGVMERTIGVLTRCDAFEPTNTDESKLTSLVRMLRRCGESRYGDGGGPEKWYAVSNRFSQRQIKREWALRGNQGSLEHLRLVQMQRQETYYFHRLLQEGAGFTSSADEKLLRECLGMNALWKQVQRVYKAFITVHWVPVACRKLLSCIDEEHVNLLRFGPAGSLADTAMEHGAREVREFVRAKQREFANVGVGAVFALWRCIPTDGETGIVDTNREQADAHLSDFVDGVSFDNFADGGLVEPALTVNAALSNFAGLASELSSELSNAVFAFTRAVAHCLADPDTAQSFVQSIRKREDIPRWEKAPPADLVKLAAIPDQAKIHLSRLNLASVQQELHTLFKSASRELLMQYDEHFDPHAAAYPCGFGALDAVTDHDDSSHAEVSSDEGGAHVAGAPAAMFSDAEPDSGEATNVTHGSPVTCEDRTTTALRQSSDSPPASTVDEELRRLRIAIDRVRSDCHDCVINAVRELKRIRIDWRSENSANATLDRAVEACRLFDKFSQSESLEEFQPW